MNDLNWRFDNSYSRLPESFFARLQPTPVRAPRLVLFNDGLARQLGLEAEAADAATLAEVLAGNRLPEGSEPLAQAYAGHQFGHFTMLGDGRAIVLGEHVAPDGRRFDIQFKGSGPTPYSRHADGRAALGPMLREYIISEAMHGLRIPTTRSLAVVATGEPIYREQALPGAVLTRVSSSHLRVGTFQYAAARGDIDGLKALVGHALARHYPELEASASPALSLLEAVIARQAGLIVDWMRVGFIHGVMNTDNMTISGETIDYGPCAFMDAYDPATAFSSIDRDRRYAFGNQPLIAQWNLARFAEALLPLLHADEDKAVAMAEERVNGFKGIYLDQWAEMMGRKLGLAGREDGDGELIDDLLDQMRRGEADYTNTFRALSQDALPPEAIFAAPAFRAWHERWQARRARNAGPPPLALSLMDAANPVYIPRNHQVEAAIEAAVERDDLAPLHALLAVLREPYTARSGLDEYTRPDPAGGWYQTFCGT